MIIAVNVRNNIDQFNCDACPWGRHCDEDMQLPGSQGPASYPKFKIEQGEHVIEQKTCFLPEITNFERQVLRYHHFYTSGVLLQEGGLFGQPALYLDLMRLVDGVNNDD